MGVTREITFCSLQFLLVMHRACKFSFSLPFLFVSFRVIVWKWQSGNATAVYFVNVVSLVIYYHRIMAQYHRIIVQYHRIMVQSHRACAGGSEDDVRFGDQQLSSCHRCWQTADDQDLFRCCPFSLPLPPPSASIRSRVANDLRISITPPPPPHGSGVC